MAPSTASSTTQQRPPRRHAASATTASWNNLQRSGTGPCAAIRIVLAIPCFLSLSVFIWLMVVDIPVGTDTEDPSSVVAREHLQELESVRKDLQRKQRFEKQKKEDKNRAAAAVVAASPAQQQQHQQEGRQQQRQSASCYKSMDDMTNEERNPVAGSRHMVSPPADTLSVELVCCNTTAGPWSIAVHHSWAPVGAQRFLDMVQANYFGNQKVPLMRCLENFVCQFGLAGPASNEYRKTLPDDPQWLPSGPVNRKNSAGVKRFAEGYLSYAGSGPNSRSNQFIISLAPVGPLGGGAPWEVPWGELVGSHSFETLRRISTVYGEHGPRQSDMRKQNAVETAEKEFPSLDFILSCRVVDRNQP